MAEIISYQFIHSSPLSSQNINKNYIGGALSIILIILNLIYLFIMCFFEQNALQLEFTIGFHLPRCITGSSG
jgi:hypothetical protein